MPENKRPGKRTFRQRGFNGTLAVLLAALLILPLYPVPVKAAYQNPPVEEIARKLEIIARKKKIPSVILKAVAFVETGWRQWDKNGNVVTNNMGPRPSLGIMQVTSYDPSDTETVNRLKYDIDFNISYAADILNAKWEMVPQIGDGDRNKLENWYFALWAYNSWSAVNNPNDAAARGRLAYQDKVLKFAATEYYKGVVTPVEITPVPASLIPPGTVPKRSMTWNTPEPFHLGDLKVGLGDEASRGETRGKTTRIAGTGRIDTVNRIALAGWPHGCETVIIARSDDFPDALAGVPLAKKYNAPILLTPPGQLDDGVVKVLNTLKPLKVIILGGEGAISKTVEEKLKEVLYWTEDIRRIAGADRFETAALIAGEFPLEGEIALATGMNFPDALSLASAAASKGVPLLLTSPGGLPDVTKKLLQEMLPRGLYIAGGEAVIPSGVLEEIVQVSGLPPERIKRFAGSDRYDTSLKIAEEFFPQTEALYLTTGQDFADPLAAGALAACRESCLLLVSPNGFEINSPTEKYIKEMPASTDVYVIGGQEKITEDTVLQVKFLLEHI